MDEKIVYKVKDPDGTIYEIHDERIPEVTPADKGKKIKVDENGKLVIE